MGRLVDGQWQDRWYDTKKTGGRFVRSETPFRDLIGEGPDARFRPQAGRYHLYVAWACPWAHRVVLYRQLKGLTAAIPLHGVGPDMLDRGWIFDETHPDTLYGLQHLYELYLRADPHHTGRVTVPVLWDTVEQTIVNNESSELIRMLDGPFDDVADPSAPLHGIDMTPPALLDDIDAINAFVYERINNGVYKAGFATTQVAYDEAVTALFDALDALEERLQDQPWLVGERLTEADWRLFTTLVRFDAVYHGHFKCSRNRLVDFPQLFDHTRALYQFPGVAQTVRFEEIRRHYFYSHDSVNPHRIVPIPPKVDWSAPVQRTDFGW